MIYITAVRPSTATDYKGITDYRWLESDSGKAGTNSRAAMVTYLEKDGNEARVAGEDGPSFVAVHEEAGTKYLRTHADKSWNNNLSALPKF